MMGPGEKLSRYSITTFHHPNSPTQVPICNLLTQFLGKLPQRWVMTVMSMLGVTAAFTMRGCMCITMTQMVVPMKTSFIQTEGICSVPETVQELQRLTNLSSVEDFDHDDSGGNGSGDASERFTWDEETQGMILASFYYGYILTHIPGGLLAQKFGGKFTMAYAILSTSTLTLLTPTVARMGSTTYLMILRFIEGLGEVKIILLIIIMYILRKTFVYTLTLCVNSIEILFTI